MERGAEIDIIDLRAIGLIGRAGQMHRPRHRLPDRIEADAARERPLAAERRRGGEDDARIDCGKAVIIEA